MPYRPMARPRCLGGKASLRKTMAMGVMGPLPMPCSTRKKMSVGPLQAMPQSIELPTKVSKPRRKRLRLPRRLPSQPTVGMSTAPAIMYAVRIHCAWSKLRPKVVMMGGRATFIAEPLTTTRKALSMTVAVTHHLYDALSGAIARLRSGAWTGVGTGDAAVGSAVRKNVIWGLYIKRRMCIQGFLSNDRYNSLRRQGENPRYQTDHRRSSHTPARIFCSWLL